MANSRTNRRRGNGNNRKGKADEEAEVNSKQYMAVGLIMVIVAVALIALMFMGGDSQEAYNNANENDDGNVLIPLTDITDTASYYQKTVDGVTVKYFALRGSDGQIHAAFDACDVCYHAKQGYEQRGDEMVCENCGLSYPTNGIGTENIGGGCWPGYLQTSMENGNLVITEDALARGKYYFS